MTQKIIISSGFGPSEVGAFVKLLAHRLERLCQKQGYTPQKSISVGDKKAPRSITLVFEGNIRPLLVDELGTHALIAKSTHRTHHPRKRWFASVQLEIPTTALPLTLPQQIPSRDIQITACRARGPGGQHVNKTNSAIQLRHLPTGLKVRVESERSQHANKQIAINKLIKALTQTADTEACANKKRSRKQKYQLERGKPVRIYNLNRNGQLIIIQ